MFIGRHPRDDEWLQRAVWIPPWFSGDGLGLLIAVDSRHELLGQHSYRNDVERRFWADQLYALIDEKDPDGVDSVLSEMPMPGSRARFVRVPR